MRPLRDEEPRRIGPYRVLAELGEGGMGRVLLAAADDGQLVALKVMRPHLLHDAQFRFRFRREVITSREVAASPWTAAVLASDEDAPEPWLASEFFHGPTLAEAIGANGPLDEPASRRLMHGLAAGLADVHRHNVVHRDLKPSNVILTEDGVKIIDFGIARVPGPQGDATITETGALVGAPAYMSPEQITKRPVGPPSDLFSLGTSVITAGTGQSPFDAESLFDIMSNVVNGRPDLRALPVSLRPLVEACMDKDPDRRVTAADLLARVGEPLAGPWPPSIAALEARQRDEVADLARRNGWDTQVRPDRTVVMFGPGFVPAGDPMPEGPTVVQGAAQDAGDPIPEGPTTPYPPDGSFPHPPGGLPPAPKPDRTILYGAFAIVAVIALAGLVFLLGDRDEPEPGSGAGEESEETSAYEDWDGDWDSETTATEPEPEPDPIRDAAIGDCFYDYGGEFEADLEPAYCDDGTFEVVDVFYGNTDLSSCDYTDRVSTRVSSSAHDMVLCLSYRHGYGDAYHAEVGECVFGPEEADSVWYVIDCQTGAFRVLERLPGESDMDLCTDSTYYNHAFWFTTSETYLDVLLCLQYIYPDDMGYAELNNCMYMSGDPSAGATYTFSDCDGANVYVTGRTDEYEASGFCGNDGWSTWASSDFAVHRYTVCWRYL
ncbi:serine/threonine-protein kinase [Glycomyces sp. NRRL B-16210]|uniref:serine/threonine protein kinase n=1 Tax=Glycomyces sp. NRRL B-16210 TaxID=1463821 RepID=UPI0009DE642F|nr:serine/threonine-protein kinase [Glycomyces sp. NRRL B-16210]